MIICLNVRNKLHNRWAAWSAVKMFGTSYIIGQAA